MFSPTPLPIRRPMIRTRSSLVRKLFWTVPVRWAVAFSASPNMRASASKTASDGSPGDVFGWSPAVTNNLAVVGAAGAGAAYVFVKPNNGWTSTSQFVMKLTPADGSRGAFGFSTAIGTDAIVAGVVNSPGGGPGPGGAFVFGP